MIYLAKAITTYNNRSFMLCIWWHYHSYMSY